MGKGCNMADSRQMVRVVMWNGRGEGVPAGAQRVVVMREALAAVRRWAGDQAAAAAEGARAEGAGGGAFRARGVGISDGLR